MEKTKGVVREKKQEGGEGQLNTNHGGEKVESLRCGIRRIRKTGSGVRYLVPYEVVPYTIAIYIHNYNLRFN